MKHFTLLLKLVPLLLIAFSAHAQLWNGIISAPRAVDWSGAGVVGGIPSGSWTQCGSTIAAGASYTTINSAIAACGANQYVLLGAGTFNLAGGLLWNAKSNVVVRGAGANQTFLIFSASNTCQGLVGDICFQSSDTNYAGGPSNVSNWTAGYSRGTTSITLSALVTGSTPPVIGTPLTLDQTDDAATNITSGFSNTSGNIWQVSFSSCSTTNGVYFNETLGTQVGSSGAVTAPGDWYCNSGTNILYVYSTSNPASAFTTPVGVTATSDTGDQIFVNYTPQYVYSTNGDTGGAPRASRSQQQIVTVTSITGTGPYTVGISPGLYMPNWISGKTPQAWWPSNPISNSGVENLSMDHSAAEPTSGNGVGTIMFNCSGCWVKGVRSILPGRSHVMIFQSTHATVQDSYFFGTAGTLSSSYGVEAFPASDSLIQNNIFQQIPGPVAFNGSCSGCVQAYNFDINDIFGSGGVFNWQIHSSAPHAVGNDSILVEGNQGAGMDADVIHGTHHFITDFRNNWNGFQPNDGMTNTGNTIAILIRAFNRFFNVIGNVLGSPGNSTAYTYTGSGVAIYTTGGGDQSADDAFTTSTLMRWGNYDVVSAATRWCGNSSNPGWSTTCASTSEVPTALATYPNTVPSSTALPASFYLSSKPSWWPSAKAWPAIGPDVSGGNLGLCPSGTYSGLWATNITQCGVGGSLTAAYSGLANSIPAMDCYLTTMGGVLDGTGSVLSFNASTCYSSSPTVAPPSALLLMAK